MDWKLFGTGAIVSKCHKQSQPLYNLLFLQHEKCWYWGVGMQSVGTEGHDNFTKTHMFQDHGDGK